MSIFELDVRDLAANRDVKGLIDALNYEKADIRSTVADALPEIGTDAQIALPALIEALKDGDETYGTMWPKQYIQLPARFLCHLLLKHLRMTRVGYVKWQHVP